MSCDHGPWSCMGVVTDGTVCEYCGDLNYTFSKEAYERELKYWKSTRRDLSIRIGDLAEHLKGETK